MSGTTNYLINLAKNIDRPAPENTMLWYHGRNMASLVAMSIQSAGHKAISLTDYKQNIYRKTPFKS